MYVDSFVSSTVVGCLLDGWMDAWIDPRMKRSGSVPFYPE